MAKRIPALRYDDVTYEASASDLNLAIGLAFPHVLHPLGVGHSGEGLRAVLEDSYHYDLFTMVEVGPNRALTFTAILR